MTTRHLLTGLLALLALMPVQTFAGELKKLPAALNPAKAYVVVEIGKVDDGLLYGSLVLARYDTEKKEIAEPATPAASKSPAGGTAEEYRVSLLKPAVKSGDQRFYIAELDPGLWVIEGANDTAFSLGSSTMQLAAGSATDLGVVTVYSDFADGEKRDVATSGRLLKGALMGGIFARTIPASVPKALDLRARGASDIPLPPVFAGVARPPEWAGEVQFGNHLGGLINRMGGRKARLKAQAAEDAAPQAQEPAAPKGN
jgi:hypothetical protein